MAIHLSTPPFGGGERPRLPSAQVGGLFRRRNSFQPSECSGSGGPVTQAIRAVRAAEPLPPADAAIEAIRDGLIRYFVEDDRADRGLVRNLRRRIAHRIEADLALLDALDGDTDLEVENEHGGDVQDEPHDPEEDADCWEVGSTGPVTFDGTNYGRVRL